MKGIQHGWVCSYIPVCLVGPRDVVYDPNETIMPPVPCRHLDSDCSMHLVCEGVGTNR